MTGSAVKVLYHERSGSFVYGRRLTYVITCNNRVRGLGEGRVSDCSGPKAGRKAADDGKRSDALDVLARVWKTMG